MKMGDHMGKNPIKIKRNDITGYLFIAPAVVAFTLFLVYPAFEAVRLSFYHITLKSSTFVGFENFEKLLKDRNFHTALANTFKYVLFLVPLTMAFSIFISVIIFSKKERVTSFYRGVFYIPTIASAVTVSLVWNWIYNPVIGVANYILSILGIPPQEWLSMADTAFGAVVLVILTTSVGQPIILYTAALGGISKEYYEAAEIDGASKIKQFFNITWPLLKPTSLYILVISTINAFQTFTAVQLLTNGGPSKATTTIIYELYEVAFSYHNYGYASAIGVILFIMIGIAAFFQFRFMTSKAEF